MPILIVYGMPKSTIGLKNLIKCLQESVSSVTELYLEENQITVLFPPDLVDEGLGEELICIVEGLIKKRNRTPEVLKQLAEKIRETLKIFSIPNIPNCTLVEVFVKKFDPEKDGFAGVKIMPSGKQINL